MSRNRSSYNFNLPFQSCLGMRFSNNRTDDDNVSLVDDREPVILNVYDMLWTNDYTRNIGIGVYHSGVEVYGSEYGFGGHQLPFSGIFEICPKSHIQLGEQFRFSESIVIGYTAFTEEEVRHIIDEMGKQFRGDRYHLMNNNCNHFSSNLAQILSGSDIPSWVNRLATFSSCVPFLEQCLPKEWLTPVALQHCITQQKRQSSSTYQSDLSPN